MVRKYALPLLAAGLLFFAVLHVVGAHATPEKAAPPVTPTRSPFGRAVSGVGVVEAQTQNIAIASGLSGVVAEVPAQVGTRVRAGTVLFRLDDRAARAERKVREAGLASAQAQLARLDSLPRPEELPAAEARLGEARANLELHRRLHAISRNLHIRRAASREELVQREQAHQAAAAGAARAEADLTLLRAGPSQAEKDVARAAVEQARAQLKQAQAELDRLVVRAPVDGEVLRVNVCPGEFAEARAGQGLIVLGNVGRLHVRVEIDEHDIPRFHPGSAAAAALRGNPHVTFRLSFVRVEPYVIPKKALTNEGGERVDTRVLHVIYAVEPPAGGLYVGQQLDVSIDASR
jgi:multidrug resistance efflux pump